MSRPAQGKEDTQVRDQGWDLIGPYQGGWDLLSRVLLQSATQLTAEYARYAKSDALCCPSRVTQVTFEIAGDPPVVRAKSASTSPTRTP